VHPIAVAIGPALRYSCSAKRPHRTEANVIQHTAGVARPLLAVVLALAAAGCSEPASGDGANAGTAQADGTGGLAFDGGTLPVADGAAGSSDLGATDAANSAKVCPGGAGCPCDKASDCDNSSCIDTPQGSLCAQNCTDNCPEGFVCKLKKEAADVASICVPKWGRLCDPCDKSGDCDTLGPDFACIAYGAAGNFCGTACASADDCPTGYGCEAAQSAEGAQFKGCVKLPSAGQGGLGTCPCSPRAIAKKLQTTCYLAGAGTAKCPGNRACGSGGLGPCSAEAPAAEICDGKDNDCNGSADDGTCNDKSSCTTDSCAPFSPEAGSDGCVHTFLPEGADCDADGTPCTMGDACLAGVCVPGKAKNCDDGNPCTVDTCDVKAGCLHTADNGAPCDDGDACTASDVCSADQCQGKAKACKPAASPCQTSACDPASGQCATKDKAEGSACDDGNVCTIGDVCKGGACAAGPNKDPCDDGSACTIDSCDPSQGCLHKAITKPCDDGDPCTSGEACKEGKCQGGGPTDCDDGDGCTIDACTKVKGCTHTFDASACNCVPTDPKTCDKLDDGNPCNGSMACLVKGTGFACQVDPKTVVQCDAGADSACEKNQCDLKSGKCVFTKLVDGKPCDADGSVCTQNDACAAGLCAKGEAKDCNDGNPCTTDSCDPKTGCAAANNAAACDDGKVCTEADACKNGACQPGLPKACSDNNPCTDDSCSDAKGGCQHVANAAVCDDNNACTKGEGCKAGACVPTGPPDCNDANPCTTDSCDPKVGCQNAANTAPCDDGNACTANDACAAKACQPGKAKGCDDGQSCTDDSCDPKVGCQNAAKPGACDDGNVCTKTDTCQAGQCVGTGGIDCNDGNVCTDDNCDPSGTGCTHTANSKPCDDGNLCTDDDACAAKACVAGGAKACTDGNACTDDTCKPASGCAFVHNSAPCNDGNACTTGDACQVGQCAPGAPKVCTDGNPCTADSCNPQAGCTTAPVAGPCDDGNPCTLNDQCVGGGCSGGTPKDCSAWADTCNNGVCQAGNCQKQPKSGSCSDGDPCTVNDACANGSCQGGGPKDCSGFGNTCNSGVCQGGNCTTQPKSGSCDDGNGCTVGDFCSGGSCQSGGPKDCSSLADACNTASCSGGGCVKKAKADGTACGGANKCVGGVCKVYSTSCTGKCGTPYDQFAPCQCDSGCTGYGDCCTDYQSKCGCGDGKCAGGETCVTCAKDCGGFTCTPNATDKQTQDCGNCGTQSRTRTCSSGCQWGAWGSWTTCSGSGPCAAGTTKSCSDPCAIDTCTTSCQWGGCKLKSGAACLWNQGLTGKCCGTKPTKSWAFCNPNTCQWYPCAEVTPKGAYCPSTWP